MHIAYDIMLTSESLFVLFIYLYDTYVHSDYGHYLQHSHCHLMY